MPLETLGDVTIKYELYPRKHRTKKDVLEIYYRFEFALKNVWLTNKRIGLSLGIQCLSKDWTGDKVKGSSVTAQDANEQVDKARLIIKKGLSKLIANEETNIANIIKEIEIGIKPEITKRTPKKEAYKKLLSTIQSHSIENLKEKYIQNSFENLGGMKENTKLKYDITCRYFTAFWNEFECSQETNINLIEIRHTDEFKKFLLRQPKDKLKPEGETLGENTVKTYLTKLRALLKYAAKPTQEGGLGLIKYVPIRSNLIGAFNDSDREPLTLNEIKKIWSLDDGVLSAAQTRTKYLFLFMAGSGTGYTEAKSLKPEHFEEVEEGLVFLNKGRTKNNKKFGVTLLPFAVDAYYYFKSQPDFFGVIKSETAEKKNLINLINLAGIDNENITLYVGRTTFITNLLAQGIDKYQVKDMVGHANLSMLGKYDKSVAKIKAKAHQRAYEGTGLAGITKE